MIDEFYRRDAIAQMMTVQPNYTFHLVDADADGLVHRMKRRERSRACGSTAVTSCSAARSSTSSATGEELVREPFDRIMDLGRLSAYRHDGFWVPLDTIKDKQVLDEMYDRGVRPWCVWEDEPLAALDETP